MIRTSSPAPRVQRLPFRTGVRFGPTGTLVHFGETADLSPAGIGARSTTLPETGTRLSLQLVGAGGECASVEGIVAWTQPPEVRGEPGRFGVRLIVADAAYLRLVAQVAGRSTRAA